MDNATHTLAGLLLAEIVVRARARRGEPSPHWTRSAYLVSVLGNNLPDLDFAYVGISDGRLGYLLHHRGHTHTILLGMPLGLLALGLVLLLGWRRREELGPGDGWALAGLSLLGPLLHVLMDFSNSYGVHPFWPIDARWVHGDSVFIVEPLFWMAALPSVFLAVRARAGKTVLALWLSATAVIPLASGVVALPFALAVPLGTVILLTVLWKRDAVTRVAVGTVASLAVLATLVISGRIARARLAEVAAQRFPGDVLHDIVLTPLPANPTCWSFLLVATTEADDYVVRRGRLALAPWLVPAAQCTLGSRQLTAPLEPAFADRAPEGPARAALASGDGSDALLFDRQFRAPRRELVELAAASCEVRAFLRFSRVPYWLMRGADSVVVGDLRFDRDPELGFAELAAARAPTTCPRFVPPWTSPRQDVLGARR